MSKQKVVTGRKDTPAKRKKGFLQMTIGVLLLILAFALTFVLNNGLNFKKESYHLKKGEQVTLQIENEKLTPFVSFHVRDKDVADVEEGDKLTGISEGETVVYSDILGVREKSKVVVN
ncbi:MAG: hypothetical protein U0K57_08345 [Lachnospiraceae bacterium]|nr:hypothetical protein [Lachnospiraceae bacterium]